MDDETLKILAFIHISTYRTKTLLALYDGDKTPTQIVKFTGIRITHTSNVLRELKDRDVVECINEEKRVNRIYRLTDRGHEIAEELDYMSKHF